MPGHAPVSADVARAAAGVWGPGEAATGRLAAGCAVSLVGLGVLTLAARRAVPIGPARRCTAPWPVSPIGARHWRSLAASRHSERPRSRSLPQWPPTSSFDRRTIDHLVRSSGPASRSAASWPEGC